MRNKKTDVIRTTEKIDFKTGEIEESTVVTTFTEKIPNEPAFIKLYLADILYLKGLQTTQSSLLFALLQQMNYQNEIVLNASIKRRIAKDVGLTTGTIDNNLSNFVKKNILFRVDRGVYQANPILFGRGEWKDIYKLRLEVEYSNNGERKLKTAIEQQEEPLTPQAEAQGCVGY